MDSSSSSNDDFAARVVATWREMDRLDRGFVSFGELPALCEALGMALTVDELEDAASRIQRWQASRLLLAGFGKWCTGDVVSREECLERALARERNESEVVREELDAAMAETADLRAELEAQRRTFAEERRRLVAERDAAVTSACSKDERLRRMGRSLVWRRLAHVLGRAAALRLDDSEAAEVVPKRELRGGTCEEKEEDEQCLLPPNEEEQCLLPHHPQSPSDWSQDSQVEEIHFDDDDDDLDGHLDDDDERRLHHIIPVNHNGRDDHLDDDDAEDPCDDADPVFGQRDDDDAPSCLGRRLPVSSSSLERDELIIQKKKNKDSSSSLRPSSALLNETSSTPPRKRRVLFADDATTTL